jgi:protein involved in polysaccharide export with SLBB domain
MQQIIAAVGEYDGLALSLPALALLDQLGVIVEPAQGLKYSVTIGGAGARPAKFMAKPAGWRVGDLPH